MTIHSTLSIVIPAKNEAEGLSGLLPVLRENYPDAEIIVVNDGSDDDTAEIAGNAGATVISHPYSMGNGAAIKSGARKAKGDYILFMDADGQHRPEDIPRLLEEAEQGFDLVVGARQGRESQSSLARGLGNYFYNRLASMMVNRKIDDLTSGFRVVKAKKFRDFLSLLPNGFSYPTTSTMAFFRVGYAVSFVPIVARKRKEGSHVSVLRDGIKFFLIIFKISALYSPLKIFFPIAFSFIVSGVLYYLYTYINFGRFTNMSMLMLVSGVLIFLIGLISEQITALLYKDINGDKHE